MNELIKELARQAEWFAGTEYNKQTIATFHTNKSAEEFFKEKFAELIVKKCIDTLEFHGFDDAVPYIRWMATNHLGIKND